MHLIIRVLYKFPKPDNLSNVATVSKLSIKNLVYPYYILKMSIYMNLDILVANFCPGYGLILYQLIQHRQNNPISFNQTSE